MLRRNRNRYAASGSFRRRYYLLEQKALTKLEDVNLTQSMNYGQAYNLPIGLLVNFGGRSLEFKRIY
ncbi:MAG: GxxExxY protein [Prevotella sp.]|nr:GxxExxY protein [Prevotella sp.]